MTLTQLEAIRDSIKTQLEATIKNQPAPGQDVMKYTNIIELLAAVRTMEQCIVQERAEHAKPPGATGPVLVGV